MYSRIFLDKNKDDFFQAIIANQLAIFEYLLSRVDINQQNMQGYTPLMVAIQHNRKQFVKKLLLAGAEVNKQNHAGWTALMLARFQRRYTLINWLLNANADLGIKNLKNETVEEMDFGDSPLITPIIFNDIYRFEKLIIHSRQADCQAALDVALKLQRHTFLALLLERKLILSTQQYLHAALRNDDFVSFHLLLKAGANPDEKDEFQNAVLHMAVAHNKIPFAALLLKKGANVDIQDRFFNTPILLAVKQKNTAMAKVLMKYKPNLMLKNWEDETVQTIAKEDKSIRQFLSALGVLIETKSMVYLPESRPSPANFFSKSFYQKLSLLSSTISIGLVAYLLLRPRAKQ